MRDKIRKFLFDNYIYGTPPEGFDDDTSFVSSGALDSTGVMELILFIEEQFDIKVKNEELVPENLDSVNRICQYVQSKQAVLSVAGAGAWDAR